VLCSEAALEVKSLNLTVQQANKSSKNESSGKHQKSANNFLPVGI